MMMMMMMMRNESKRWLSDHNHHHHQPAAPRSSSKLRRSSPQRSPPPRLQPEFCALHRLKSRSHASGSDNDDGSNNHNGSSPSTTPLAPASSSSICATSSSRRPHSRLYAHRNARRDEISALADMSTGGAVGLNWAGNCHTHTQDSSHHNTTHAIHQTRHPSNTPSITHAKHHIHATYLREERAQITVRHPAVIAVITRSNETLRKQKQLRPQDTS
jgi:hypothetical protein